MDRPRVLIVMGTRPEAIKLAPVIEALRADGELEPVLVATSQHRQMLRQALAPFGLAADVDLDVMTADQTPSRVASEVMARLQPVLARERPLWTVVQGDTTSALAAAMASFYGGVPVAHVEAGLRTGRLDAPFPEEFNRRAIAVATSLHFAPTRGAVDNLRREGVEAGRILLVGNTVVDAVHRIMGQIEPPEPGCEPPLILMTLHRRESFGEPIRRILRAVRRLLESYAGRVRLAYPVHPNPNVDPVARGMLAGLPGAELTEPLDYPGFLAVFAAARFALSDSGGVQEEGPSLGVPVLVLREVSERPELIESGWGRLVGTDEEEILRQASLLLDDDAELASMKRGDNPFGDGESGARIARALAERAG